MFYRTRRHVPMIVAGAAVGMTGLASVATAAEPTAQDLMAQIKELQTKVQQLEANQQTSPDAGDATVASVLADAETRSQMLQSSSGDVTSGFTKNKFVLTSPDGNFTLSPNLHLQVRGVFNARDNDDDNNGDDDTDWQTDSGFEIRRAKFGFGGNMFSRELTYEFLWEVNRDTGALNMQDAWAKYVFNQQRRIAVRVGQFKNPVGREQTSSGKRLLLADRSIVNDVLLGGENYVQGVSLIYAPPQENYRLEAAFHDGNGTSNTNFQGESLANRNDWGVGVRTEVQLIGEKFRGYDDYTAMGNTGSLLVVGAGFDYTENGDQNVLTYTADAQWENAGGTSAFVAAVGRNRGGANQDTNVNFIEEDAHLFDWGWVAQAGQMLNPKTELFGRVSYLQIDEDGVPFQVENNVWEVTAGVNYYLHGHGSKITADVTWLPEGVPSNSGTGYLGSQTGLGYLPSNEDQVVVRLQYQLLI